MKDKWRNYALKSGKVKSSYQREYCNRKKCRKAGEAGNSNIHVESWKVQPEVKEEVGSHESIREEKSAETYQQGQQGIQAAVERRPKASKRNLKIQAGEEEVKEKMTPKEKKHEANESKAYEKKEDRKEAKKEAPKKKK